MWDLEIEKFDFAYFVQTLGDTSLMEQIWDKALDNDNYNHTLKYLAPKVRKNQLLRCFDVTND